MKRAVVSAGSVLFLLVLASPVWAQLVSIESTADGSEQSALWFPAQDDTARPLLVGLHPWGMDVTHEPDEAYRAIAAANGWHFIYPNFRGKNERPEAGGSELAVCDVVDAVQFARAFARVDSSRIYLVGVSGGGHMALMLAGRYPDLWAGVSAWVAPTDLTRWYAERVGEANDYASNIRTLCGGDPLTDAAAAEECARRSPLSYLAAARGVNLDINVGIRDGHPGGGTVPVSHSLRAFNAVAAVEDRLTDAEIERFDRGEVPSRAALLEPRSNAVLFRRESGRARLTVFDGGHEIDYATALRWLGEQRREPARRRAAR